MNAFRYINNLLRRIQTLGVKRVRPRIRRIFPHDEKAYTQGLVYHRGFLYESTGLPDASSLRRIALSDGHIVEQVSVPGDFAEGITIVNDRLYQLTWQSGRVFIYDLSPLRLMSEAAIDHEGWGLTNDGAHLLVSDGTCRIRRYNASLSLANILKVHTVGFHFRHLNDIEVGNGRLYANVWCTSLLAEIDLASGRVTRLVDCAELDQIESPRNIHHIMNGVAFDSDAKSFFLTGKHWQRYFEIEIPAVGAVLTLLLF